MSALDRRLFLGSSLGGMAAALAAGPSLLAQDKAKAKAKAKAADPIVSKNPLDSLFLTWQQDPTTTMTVQWVGPDATADESVRVSPAAGESWQTRKTTTKPYPNTELKVHRCELTGLAPDTEYKFQIGES